MDNLFHANTSVLKYYDIFKVYLKKDGKNAFKYNIGSSSWNLIYLLKMITLR